MNPVRKERTDYPESQAHQAQLAAMANVDRPDLWEHQVLLVSPEREASPACVDPPELMAHPDHQVQVERVVLLVPLETRDLPVTMVDVETPV